MTEQRDKPDLRRILVALDAGGQNLADLEEAARLAAGLQAELVGLFIEDTELFSVAALPVARMISHHGRPETGLDTALMQRALRVLAARSRESLAAAAQHWQVRWSFQVARGSLAEQLLLQVQDFDLLALGKAGSPMREARLRAETRRVTEQARCSVLLLHRAVRPNRPVVVIYEGAERPLALGQSLSRVYGSPLVVLALGRDTKTAESLERGAAKWLGGKGAVHRLAGAEAAQVAKALHELSASVVVLDRHGSLAPQIESVLGETDCSVLVLK
jgi:nucleotide-binding universal stress UspA family protein